MFWTHCVNARWMECIAPALHLRYNVPAAGTAAIRATKVGWSDAKHVYGRLLREQKALEEKLELLLNDKQGDRWAYAINGKLYGQTGQRLNIEELKPLAATVTGIYKSGASKATLLLLSPALIRETAGAPLQTDVSQYVVKAIRDVFVGDLRIPKQKQILPP